MTDRWQPRVCRRCGALACAVIIAAGAAFPAYADEEAGPEDRARITEVLQAAGYESFEDAEMDDGVWEVDDAVGRDGEEYDLELDPDTLQIIEIEED